MVLFLFFCLLGYTIPTVVLDAMLQALIFCLYFFTCLALFISVTPSHKSNTNNNLRIITIKIIIIKVNIIKVFSIKRPISSLKNGTLSESSLKKGYIIIREYSIFKFFKHFGHSKSVRNKF